MYILSLSQMYIVNFKAHGYDDTTFLPGMAEQDLMDIGISNRGHRQKLLRDIKKLPDEEMAHEVPVSLFFFTSNVRHDTELNKTFCHSKCRRVF